jgi:nicotinate-nucleotide adenylyltransferase
MKVGLLGGSFNPPHQGHIYISNLAIKKLGLHQVWWIPTLQNPLKHAAIYESYRSRLQQCEKLIEHHPKLRIKQFDEIYTEKLISTLKAKYRNIEFFWLMGADNLENFHKWKNFQKLPDMIPFVIFSRGDCLRKIRKTRAWKFFSDSKYLIFHSKNLDISSTEIRNSHE